MNEKEKEQNIQTEKTGLDEKRKTALLRYVAIMFAVAFVLVLLSLLGQMRDSKTAISQLNQSSSSAWQKAEHLQEHNQELETENQELTRQVQELEKQIANLEGQMQGTGSHIQDLQEENDQLRQEQMQLLKDMDAQAEDYENTVHAYELLLKLQNAVTSGNGSAESLRAELKTLESYLGENARKTFENLLVEGE